MKTSDLGLSSHWLYLPLTYGRLTTDQVAFHLLEKGKLLPTIYECKIVTLPSQISLDDSSWSEYINFDTLVLFVYPTSRTSLLYIGNIENEPPTRHISTTFSLTRKRTSTLQHSSLRPNTDCLHSNSAAIHLFQPKNRCLCSSA